MYLKSYSNLIWFIFESGFEIGKENRKLCILPLLPRFWPRPSSSLGGPLLFRAVSCFCPLRLGLLFRVTYLAPSRAGLIRANAARDPLRASAQSARMPPARPLPLSCADRWGLPVRSSFYLVTTPNSTAAAEKSMPALTPSLHWRAQQVRSAPPK